MEQKLIWGVIVLLILVLVIAIPKWGKKEGRKGENNKVAQVVYGDVEKVKPEGV